MVGAVVVTRVDVQQTRVVLEQHGIDPDADVDDLTALLAARGWRVTVEQAFGRGRGQVPRWSGNANLAAPPDSPKFRHGEHIRSRGVDEQEVLTRILARVLEKEPAS